MTTLKSSFTTIAIGDRIQIEKGPLCGQVLELVSFTTDNRGREALFFKSNDCTPPYIVRADYVVWAANFTGSVFLGKGVA